MAAFGRITPHVTKLKLFQTGSNGIHSLQILIQQRDVVECVIYIMDLQQLCIVIMSKWIKITKECFQHLVESPQ